MAPIDPRAAELLSFWFRNGDRDKRWFGKDPAFDAEVRVRFLALYEQAAAGALTAWRGSPAECLALVIALDQLPRNIFRGSARAFASDADALVASKHAVARGDDRATRPVERLFLYLPFEHAESLEEQRRACELLEPLALYAETQDVYRYALAHLDVIARFGRFPHRNALLGRPSTPEELEFLKTPGSAF